MDKKKGMPLDKETDARLEDQINKFKASAWKAALDDLELEFRNKGKRTVPFDDPGSCGFEIFDDGRSVFKIIFGFQKYWPNERYNYWNVRLSISTHVPGTRISGYENRCLQDEIQAISARDIIVFIKNLFPIMMILKD